MKLIERWIKCKLIESLYFYIYHLSIAQFITQSITNSRLCHNCFVNSLRTPFVILLNLFPALYYLLRYILRLSYHHMFIQWSWFSSQYNFKLKTTYVKYIIIHLVNLISDTSTLRHTWIVLKNFTFCSRFRGNDFLPSRRFSPPSLRGTFSPKRTFKALWFRSKFDYRRGIGCVEMRYV